MRSALIILSFAALFLSCSDRDAPIEPGAGNGTTVNTEDVGSEEAMEEVSEEDRQLLEELGY